MIGIDTTEFAQRLVQKFLAVEELLGCSDWLEKYHRLPVSASHPGAFSFQNAPYTRGVCDALSDPEVSDIVLMWSSQVGKTELFLAIMSYLAALEPSQMLFIMQTEDHARAFSSNRLVPAIHTNPRMQEVFPDPLVKSNGNKTLSKTLKGGGVLEFRGAQSPNAFSNVAARFLLADEVDRWPLNFEKEGSPIVLAEKRTESYADRALRLWASTPTESNTSAIHKKYLEGDQCRFSVPCSHCGGFLFLEWEKFKFDHEEGCYTVCPHCACLLFGKDRFQMVRGGKWVPTAEPTRAGVRSFHLWQGYSLIGNDWDAMVRSFKAAKDDYTDLKAFINTTLAEPWEHTGDSINAADVPIAEDQTELLDDAYKGMFLTVDVQKDRLELKTLAVTLDGWIMIWAYEQIEGNPQDKDDACWTQMEQIAQNRTAVTQSGRVLKIAVVGIDSGWNTDVVYQIIARNKFNPPFVALKGSSVADAPLLNGISVQTPADFAKNGYRPPIHSIGTGQAKDDIAYRVEKGVKLSIARRAWSEKLIEGLSSEYRILTTRAGAAVYRWVKKKGVRNEPLDLLVYGVYLSVRFASLLKFLDEPERDKDAPMVEKVEFEDMVKPL